MHQACGIQVYAIWPRNYTHSFVYFISVISWGGPSDSSNLLTHNYLWSSRGVWVQLTNISTQHDLTLIPAWISNRLTAHCCEWSHNIVMLSSFPPSSNEYWILTMITMCVVICITRLKKTIPRLQWLYHWSLGMDKQFHPTQYNGCNYLFVLRLKLICWTGKGPKNVNKPPCVMPVRYCYTTPNSQQAEYCSNHENDPVRHTNNVYSNRNSCRPTSLAWC